MSQAIQLAQGLAAMGTEFPEGQQQKLLAYLALLEKWNKTFSLTALRDPAKAVSHHLLDSLAILPYLRKGPLLDVGSGGGQPGIPLAIVHPELAITLLDSNSKKTAFLQQAIIELGLGNVTVQAGRVEQFAPREGFGMIVSRAFAEMSDFVGLTRSLLAPQGRWLAMKGIRPDDEISRLPDDIAVEAIHPLTVPGVEGERHLAILAPASEQQEGK